ncbi:MAG: ligand-binding sensor domain-containing protein [Thermodesulfobacteriota bacterium]
MSKKLLAKFLFLLIIFSILTTFSFSEGTPLRKPLTFQYFTPKEGLSSEMVYAIAVQGDDVWFGTYAGGATFYNRPKKIIKAYTTKGEPMDTVDDGVSINWKNLLPYNHVTVILPDVDRIWFGTHFYGFKGGGISYFHPQRQPPWKVFNTNNGRAKKIISMALDGETLWVGSEKGLNSLDKKTEAWKQFFSTQEGISGNFINTILIQSDSLWIGTNGGISRLLKGKKIWRNYSQKEGLSETEIKSIIKIEDRIWAGESGGGLYEYDVQGDRWKRFESKDPLKNGSIHSMALIKGKVFICRENGVSIFDLQTRQWESLTTSDGLLSNMVLCVAEDRGGIWFGTDRGASKLILNP